MKAAIISVAVVATFTFLGGNALAYFETRDLVEDSGDGLLTFDSDTGNEWLNLTVTTGYSYDSVFADLIDEGYDIQGFQVASTVDVQDLFRKAGWTGAWNTHYYTEASYDEGVDIVNLLGATAADGDLVYAIRGMVDATDDTSGNQYYSQLWAQSFYDDDSEQYSYDSSVFHDDYSAPPGLGNGTIGTFLYRAPVVPVPAAALLGLLGLGVASAKLHRRRELIDE